LPSITITKPIILNEIITANKELIFNDASASANSSISIGRNSDFIYTVNKSGFMRQIFKNNDKGNETATIYTLENDIGHQFSLALTSSNYNLTTQFANENRSNLATIASNAPNAMQFLLRYAYPFIWRIAENGSLLPQREIMTLYPNGNLSVTGNITTNQTGFFGSLGSLTSRITELFVRDINLNGILSGSGSVNLTGNATASYFIGNGSLLTDITTGNVYTHLSNFTNDMAFINSTQAQVYNDTLLIAGINATLENNKVPYAGAINSLNLGSLNVTANYAFFDYVGNLTNKTTKLWAHDIDASGNINVSGNATASYFIGNGSLLTDLPAGGGVLAPNYLASDLTATNDAYTTVFNITLSPNKMNIIRAYLAQSSSTSGVSIQNRAIISESGPAGYCNFVTQTQASTEVADNIAVGTNSADTGTTAMGLDIGVPFINTVTCTVIADSSQRNLLIQFNSETSATVTTYEGSYYTNAVN